MEAQGRHGPRVQRRRSARRGRAIRRGLLVASGLLIALAGGFAWEGLSARAALQRAEPLLVSARDAAAGAQLDVATRDLRAAHTHVLAAKARATGPFTRIVGAVPVAGRTARAMRVAAEAADLAVRAGLRATEATGVFPSDAGDGTPSFGFHEGRIPVEAWRQAAAPIAEADVLAAQATARAATAPRSLIVPAVARALVRLDEDLAALRAATAHAVSLSKVIPALAGGDGPRRYLLAFQNPAELRATGGLLGGVALLEARDGVIQLGGERPDNDFGPLDAPPIQMPTWFVDRYDRLKGLTLWSNINMEPDFPTAAPLIAAYYTKTTGQAVDGVIALDPHALAAMLQATGPVKGPHGYTFDAATAAKFIMNDTYALFDSNESLLRKAVVLDAASVIFDTIKRGVDPVALADALASSAHQKRIQVWMRDAETQRAIAALGVDGSFRSPDAQTQMIGVVTQNAGANKIDFYLRRAIDVHVALRDDGGARVAVTVALTNTAPASGLPRDVIGPPEVKGREGVFQIGENVTYLSVYAPPEATDFVWTTGGKAAPAELNLAPHAAISSRFVEIASKTTATSTVTFDLPRGAWTEGRLRLLLPRQPVVAPDQVTVRVDPPGGHTAGGEATYRSTETANRDILVELSVRPTAWRRIKDVVWR